MVNIAPDIIATQWKQKGFSCGVWVDPPGQVWEDYVHACDELFMVVEGEVQLEMGGRTLKPHAGEEILIPAGVKHTVRNGAKPSRWLYGYKL